MAPKWHEPAALRGLAFRDRTFYRFSMFPRSGMVAALVVALIVASASARADTKSIQGTVLGTDGKPLAEADVRAERLDTKAEPALTKTDAQGHYTFKALPVGAYAVTAIVKSVPKSRALVRTRSDGWAKVDFDLRMKSNDVAVKKRYVWVKGEPGSHIGGRWVEVEQSAMPTTSAVDTLSGEDVNRVQREMKINANAGMPGR
jgi:Carboxypeptidase regulatory-like domain